MTSSKLSCLSLIYSSSLEATLGVIAAAAPSVRPLFGRNAVSADYGRYHPGSVPLQPSRKGYTSRRSWYHAPDSELGDFQNLKGSNPGAANEEAAERMSDGESSQVKLWENYSAGIVKTTDVSVTHSKPETKDLEAAAATPGQAL